MDLDVMEYLDLRERRFKKSLDEYITRGDNND